jgi:hypothetical protein
MPHISLVRTFEKRAIMSIVMHRAIGYGMPWARFEALYRELHETADVHEHLWQLLNTLEPAALIIPKDYRNSSYPGLLGDSMSRATPVHILEPNLLARAVTLGDRIDAPMGRPNDLIQIVQDPDNIHDIIFLPSAMYAKQWAHSADPVDYAFEMWGKGSDGKRGNEDGWTSITQYIETGHGPFSELLMHPDGRRAEYDYWWEQGDEGMLAGVPEEIRWFLKTFNILPDHAITEVRPLIAQWWC